MAVTSAATTRPISFVTPLIRAILDGKKTQTRRLLRPQPEAGEQTNPRNVGCPFGHPGDQLWVREKWAYRRDVQSLFSRGDSEIVYAADVAEHHAGTGWRPSRFMPKKLCRLWLKIESVRLERVDQISLNDAVAEGFDGSVLDPRAWFAQLWDSLCDESTRFERKPFVWVIGFTVNSSPSQSL